MREGAGGWARVLVSERECWWVGEGAGGCTRMLVGGQECWWVDESAGGWTRVLVILKYPRNLKFTYQSPTRTRFTHYSFTHSPCTLHLLTIYSPPAHAPAIYLLSAPHTIAIYWSAPTRSQSTHYPPPPPRAHNPLVSPPCFPNPLTSHPRTHNPLVSPEE